MAERNVFTLGAFPFSFGQKREGRRVRATPPGDPGASSSISVVVVRHLNGRLPNSAASWCSAWLWGRQVVEQLVSTILNIKEHLATVHLKHGRVAEAEELEEKCGQ